MVLVDGKTARVFRLGQSCPGDDIDCRKKFLLDFQGDFLREWFGAAAAGNMSLRFQPALHQDAVRGTY